MSTPDDTPTEHGATRQPTWRSVRESFEAATAGVLRTVATERNMKAHTSAAMLVMLVGMALPLDLATRSALIFAIAFVMFAEVLNTAIEALVNLYIGTYRRLAMLTKDAAAAGVLILAVGAVVIFFDILIVNWSMVTTNLDQVWRFTLFGVPVATCQVVILFGPRRRWLLTVLFVVAVCLMVPLIAWSVDPLFSAGALLALGASFVARRTFPARLPRGAPAD